MAFCALSEAKGMDINMKKMNEYDDYGEYATAYYNEVTDKLKNIVN